MAKITTKKPGGDSSGALNKEASKETRKEAQKPVLSAPPIIDTTPVSLPIFEEKPVVSQPKMNTVKVTRPSSGNFERLKANSPISPPPPKKAKPNLGLLILAGLFLVIVSVSKFRGSSNEVDSEFLPTDPTAREMLVRDDRAKLAMSSWKNEEPGFFGRFFKKLCLGYAKSDGCSSKPLHPFVKVTDDLGIPLAFDKEKDDKVIEQTIEHSSRAFTFNK
jgi:hypothetical protein